MADSRNGSGPHEIAVLICDDVFSIRTMLDVIVEMRAGLHVVGEAANGEQAVAAAQRLQPDVILLDLSMPVLSGLDALPGIRRASPRSRVIVLSAFTDPAVKQQALDHGADAYVEKGVHPDVIADAIESVVAKPRSATRGGLSLVETHEPD